VVDVVLELLGPGGHGEDLVDALDVDRVGESARVLPDDGHRHGPLELLGGRDQLEGHRAKLALQVLGDDENAHFRLSSDSLRARTARHPRALQR
jgi:hypothetical protein